jgi:hypothetical protein
MPLRYNTQPKSFELTPTFFAPTVLTAYEILFNRRTNRYDKPIHERTVNCGPQAERGQGPVSLEGKQMAK